MNICTLNRRARFVFVILPALLMPVVAGAAQSSRASTVQVVCPTTIDLTYTQVTKLDFGGPPDPKLEISGWQPRFTPTTVRLLYAEVGPGANASRDFISEVPDNAFSGKPGEPPVYTIWQKNEKQPTYAGHVACHYEGGFAIQQRVPPDTRVCTVHTTEIKPTPAEKSTRRFVRATVSCR